MRREKGTKAKIRREKGTKAKIRREKGTRAKIRREKGTWAKIEERKAHGPRERGSRACGQRYEQRHRETWLAWVEARPKPTAPFFLNQRRSEKNMASRPEVALCKHRPSPRLSGAPSRRPPIFLN